MPLFTVRISFVDIFVTPMASACSFPSTYKATKVPFSTSYIVALGCVRPGHITLAPFMMNFKAPLSQRKTGYSDGNLWMRCRLGHVMPLTSAKVTYLSMRII